MWLTALLAAGLVGGASAENWPVWRGPRGDSISLDTQAPIRWDPSSNLLWKVPVPGVGHASPVVWGDRIFTATAFPDRLQRALVCFDRDTGRLVWQSTVAEGPLEPIHKENTYASATPATDGERVYAAFRVGDALVVAAHFCRDGRQAWLVKPGNHVGEWGFSNEPILYKDMVIFDGDSKGDSFLIALDRETGRTRWCVHRGNKGISYSAPFIREMAGRPQLVQCGDRCVTGFDPDSGEPKWMVDGPSQEFAASPCYNEGAGLLYISSSWPESHILAIRPDGVGNVTKSKVVWGDKKGAPYIVSLITLGDILYSVNTAGVAYAYEAETGRVLWQEPLGRHHASPVLLRGLLYLINDKGEINVLRPGASFQREAKYELGEPCYASPAISQGRVWVRGFKSLFCFGDVK